MSDKEQQVIEQINDISKRGNSAEVKKDKDGNYDFFYRSGYKKE